jgi:hypothetical protein
VGCLELKKEKKKAHGELIRQVSTKCRAIIGRSMSVGSGARERGLVVIEKYLSRHKRLQLLQGKNSRGGAPIY